MWEFAPYAGLSILLGGFLGIVADRIFYGHIIDVIVHGSENLNSRNDACVGLGRCEGLNCIKVRYRKSETHTLDIRPADLVLVARLGGVFQTIEEKGCNILPRDGVDPMRSIPDHGMAPRLEHAVEGAIRKVAEVRRGPDDGKRYSGLAASIANSVDRTLLGLTERAYEPGVAPFESSHENNMTNTCANGFQSEADICVAIDCPEVV